MHCSPFLLRTGKLNKAVAEEAFVRAKNFFFDWIFVNEGILARKLCVTFVWYF